MKRLMSLVLIVALMIVLTVGCGQKQEQTDTDSQKAKQAEVMDSTRLDSAEIEAVPVEPAEAPVDSM